MAIKLVDPNSVNDLCRNAAQPARVTSEPKHSVFAAIGDGKLVFAQGKEGVLQTAIDLIEAAIDTGELPSHHYADIARIALSLRNLPATPAG